MKQSKFLQKIVAFQNKANKTMELTGDVKEIKQKLQKLVERSLQREKNK